MRFEGLDLNLLLALDVLLECRSTTEAAQRLNLSQPATSAALGRLREYFNDDLLMNLGREMVPTPKAEELAPAITDMLNIARFRIVHADNFEPDVSQRCFKLLCSDYVYDVVVAGVLARAARQAPNVTFEIGLIGPEGSRLFNKGEIDLMVTVQNYALNEHPSEMLFTDVDAVICWNNGKFANSITKGQFLAADFAAAVFGEERRPSISELHFIKNDVLLKTAVQVPSFSSLPQAVCGTDRIAVMHRSHARLFERSYPIVIHDLPIQSPAISEVAQWHRLRKNDKGIQWLMKMLREEVAQRRKETGISPH